jgi:short-subunit dehydrogenase
LAGPDVSLVLCARRAEPLQALSDELSASGAKVSWAAIDLRDPVAAETWASAAWANGPVDLLILNAGVFDGRREGEPLESPLRAVDVIATNLTGALVPALAVAERMREQGKGTLLFISSLAAFMPLADAPGYSASKAGLTAFARALREVLEPEGVRVVLAHPGHVSTDQAELQIGALPGLMTAEAAVGRILQGLACGRYEIDFPLHLRMVLSLLGVLPWRLRARLTAPFRFSVQSRG